MPFMDRKPSTGRWCLTHDRHQDSRSHTAAYGCKLRWSTDMEELSLHRENLFWAIAEALRIPQIVDWLALHLAGGRRG